MTKKQFTELGFDISATNRVWHGSTETEFKVDDFKKITRAEFINRFYNHAFDAGTIYGKAVKNSEIKKALGIKEPMEKW